MRRFLGTALWLIACLACLACLTPVLSFWQSRDSNYNTVISGGAPAAMSLVLDSSSNQYLTRTWGSAPTDGTKVTISLFFKFVTAAPADGRFFYSGSNISYVKVNGFASDRFEYEYDGSPSADSRSTESVTDTTTWHHLCLSFDSTQATGANRLHIYLDGVEVTYAVQTPIVQNTNYQMADNTVQAYIGAIGFLLPGTTLNAKLAYFYFIDGQALTPSSFTTGTGAGTTHPAAYGGTFGTNGFFLNFSGSNTNDQTSNHNDWTAPNSATFSADLPS